MKSIVTCAFVAAFTIASAFPTFAAPTNPQKPENNPQTVAYYTSGNHGIVGEPNTHSGVDYVKQDGNSGNFDQWFCGTVTDESHLNECEHSVWKWVGQASNCDQLGAGWNFVQDANKSWGSYLRDGNYCVHNNDANAH